MIPGAGLDPAERKALMRELLGPGARPKAGADMPCAELPGVGPDRAALLLSRHNAERDQAE